MEDLDYNNPVAVRRHILACMETGNHPQARSVLTEFQEFDYPTAASIRAEVANVYGTDL